jgi:hypothetical protein
VVKLLGLSPMIRSVHGLSPKGSEYHRTNQSAGRKKSHNGAKGEASRVGYICHRQKSFMWIALEPDSVLRIHRTVVCNPARMTRDEFWASVDVAAVVVLLTGLIIDPNVWWFLALAAWTALAIRQGRLAIRSRQSGQCGPDEH